MKRSSWLKLLIGSVSFCMSCSTALAYDEPVVNLGYTSFFDGGPPSGPGLYFQNYLQFYSTNRLNDNNGNRLPFPKNNLDVTAEIIQLIYLSTYRVLGGSLGVSALLPWVVDAKIDDGLPNRILRSQEGGGDLFIGPAIQYDPIMRANGEPLFVQRIELDVVAPLGSYNTGFAVNPGSNFWSLNPYWAATWWMSSKWSASTRLHYLWNAKNTHAKDEFGPFVNNTQAGQATFANMAVNYAVTEKLNLGVNSYFFYQLTDTKVDGRDMRGRREKVWAIGPGLLYNLTKEQFIFFNLYSEQGARNRAQGTNAIIRYVLHF